MLGSPRLAPDRRSLAQSAVATICAVDDRTVPHLEAEDGVSLLLGERIAADCAGDDPDRGPDVAPAPAFRMAGMVELAVRGG